MRWTPDRIRDRREELGLTQLELAQQLGMSLRTVTAWEAGDSKPQRPSKLDRVLGEASPRPSPLADKRPAELVAEINERLTELARRLPDEPRRSRGLEPPRHAEDAPDTRVPGRRQAWIEDDEWLGTQDRPNAETG